MRFKCNASKVMVLTTVVILLCPTIITVASTVPETEHESEILPHLDEIYFYIGYPEYTILELVREGLLDTAIGLRNLESVEELENLGWSISMNPGFHMCYLGVNCRDVTPDSSGKYVNYHNRAPGFELYPLNISDFRWALHLLIGDQKDAWIEESFEFINVRLDTYVPPANKFWFNPDIPPMPYDPVEAYNVLIAAGFSNATGYWVCPNGQEMRHIYVMVISALLCPSPPLFQNCVKSWNDFFGKMSDGVTDYFELDWVEWEGYDVILYNRDFDIYYLCWALRRDPDYLYDFFHRDNTVEGEYDYVGLDYPPLNRLLYMLKYGKDPNTHELITDINEMKQICYDAQWHLYNQTPYIPLYSRNYINAYKPRLTDWVESSGYGSAPFQAEMPWTYLSMHWEDQPIGGSINWNIPGPVEVLNPGTVRWAYEKTIVNQIYDGLMVVDPDTHEDKPWVATKWTMEPYINETEAVTNGMKITFSLRNDVYWHDGDPVTAEDCIWNFEFISSIRFSQLEEVWRNYIKSEKIGDYTVAIYVNTTGLWKVYDYAKSALLFPGQIWEPHWGNKTAAENFRPWEVRHPLFEGPPSDWPEWWPYDWPLTQLIGCGPYIFHEWNTAACPTYVHVARSPLWSPPSVIPAIVDFHPEALNVKSRGKWITAYIELPQGYGVTDINVSTILLNNTISCELHPTEIGDYDNDGFPDLMVKFSRADVMRYVFDMQYFLNSFELHGRFSRVTLTITAKLQDGTPFEGSETIGAIRFKYRVYVA